MNSADFDNGDEILFAASKTKTTNTCVFVPSFASACVNYQYMNTCGFVQRSIRIYPIIPSNHPIWNLCYNGDLKGIQALLNEGQVSPFSVDRWGNTLLHVGIVMWETSKEITDIATVCHFLLDGRNLQVFLQYRVEW